MLPKPRGATVRYGSRSDRDLGTSPSKKEVEMSIGKRMDPKPADPKYERVPDAKA